MYGFWTLVPPLLAITVALVKRDVVAALFLGVLSSSIIINGWGFLPPIVSEYMMGGWASGASLLMLLVLIGIMVSQITATGGFLALSRLARRKVGSRRGAKCLAWLLCILCSVDDGMAILGSGSISRPITDSFRIPREKLAYILSSVGSNFLSMMPYSAYILFGTGLIGAYAPELDSMKTYFQMIPLNAYAILSILLAGLFAAEVIPDFGPMKRAEKRAEETGLTVPAGSEGLALNELGDEAAARLEPDLKAVLLPVGGMILTLIVLYVTAGEIQIYSAALVGALTSLIYPLLAGKMKFRDISGRCFAGFQSMAPLFIILLMAFTFSSAINAMDFGDYIVTLVGGQVNRALLPLIMFIICGLVAYASGSFATGLAIICPISIPLALASGASVPLVMAACMGGSQFGDQTSPLSDVFIMSSRTAGIDVGESARILLPYKLLTAACAAGVYLALGFLIH